MFRVFALFVYLILASPVFAQDITPQPASAADQARMLVEALRNDATREALIAELEKASDGDTSASTAR